MLNKYEKWIQELQEEFEESFAEYSKQLDQLNHSASSACCRYNDYIHAINGLRQGLQDDILKLYNFLKRFGDIGIQITPFQYVTEDSKYVSNKHASGSLNYDPTPQKSPGFVKTASIAATAVFVPIALPAILIGDALKRRSQSKETYFEMAASFESQKTKWEEDLSVKREETAFYKDAAEIAALYRALIATVSMAIKNTILPELAGIDAFLVADVIKNAIISDMHPEECEIASISDYKHTAYDMHYVFVRNAFDYYQTIVKFFTEPILSKIVDDGKITSAEKQAFSLKENQIKEQVKRLEKSAVFKG